MKTVLQGTSWLLLLLCLMFTQCKKTPDTPVTPKSSAKSLTNPTIDGVTSASAVYDATNSTYTMTVPFGTDITALKLSFTVPTSATVKPALGSAQNFTNPVTYTVTAEDGSTQTYTVKVVVTAPPKSSEKLITDFKFTTLSPVVSATIDQSARKIRVTVPASNSLTTLVPTITLSPKATVAPASGIAQNFTKSVIYTVTAEDGSTQTYEMATTIKFIDDKNFGASYIVEGNNLVINLTGTFEITNLYFDINQSKRVEADQDKGYRITFGTQSGSNVLIPVILTGAVTQNFAVDILSKPFSSKATVTGSNGQYVVTIPLSELDPTGKNSQVSLFVEKAIFSPSPSQTLYPAYTSGDMFSNTFLLTIR